VVGVLFGVGCCVGWLGLWWFCVVVWLLLGVGFGVGLFLGFGVLGWWWLVGGLLWGCCLGGGGIGFLGEGSCGMFYDGLGYLEGGLLGGREKGDEVLGGDGGLESWREGGGGGGVRGGRERRDGM
jgi:hypothetical protein